MQTIEKTRKKTAKKLPQVDNHSTAGLMEVSPPPQEEKVQEASLQISSAENDSPKAVPRKASRKSAKVAAIPSGEPVAAVGSDESSREASAANDAAPEKTGNDAEFDAKSSAQVSQFGSADKNPELKESTSGRPAAGMPASAVKPLIGLVLERGVLIFIAVPLGFAKVTGFGRYEADPLPVVRPVPGSLVGSHELESHETVYAGFVPLQTQVSGEVEFGCATDTGLMPVFRVNCLPYRGIKAEGWALLIKRFGKILVPALNKVLPTAHPLNKMLQAASTPKVTPKAVPATLQGSLDGLVDGLLHGWAYDAARSDQPLTVEILSQGEVVARGTADRYRDDLEANGIGNGHHHFRLKPSYEICDGHSHELRLRVVELDAVLPNAVRHVAFKMAQPAKFDWLSRRETLALASEMLRALQKDASTRVEQALLQEMRTASLKQETWLLDGAREGYEKIMASIGPNPLCHVKIAETWMLEGQPDKALEAYDAAIALDSEYGVAYLGRGNVLMMRADPLKAEQALLKAAELLPGDERPIRRLAEIADELLAAKAAYFAESGRRDEAVNLLAGVLLRQPENQAVAMQLDGLLKVSTDADGLSSGLMSSKEVALADTACRLLEAVLSQVAQQFAVGSRDAEQVSPQ